MTREDYLALLDRFLVALAQDSTDGLILGFEDRHGDALARLIRDRPSLEGTPVAPGLDPRVIDAVRDVETALGTLRDRIGKAPRTR